MSFSGTAIAASTRRERGGSWQVALARLVVRRVGPTHFLPLSEYADFLRWGNDLGQKRRVFCDWPEDVGGIASGSDFPVAAGDVLVMPSGQVAPPAAPPLLAGGAPGSGVTSGAHLWAASYTTLYGETTLSDAAEFALASAAPVSVTVPAPLVTSVTGARVYRTRAGEYSPFFLAASAPAIEYPPAPIAVLDLTDDAALAAQAAPPAASTANAYVIDAVDPWPPLYLSLVLSMPTP